MSSLFTTFAVRSALLVGLAAERGASPPTSPRKSASTGRPTIRCRWCSRTRGCSRRSSPRTASRSAGCRRSAPTRRWSSSTPARSISARPRARPRWSPRSTATRSSRSTSIRGPEWTALVTRKDTKITKIEDLKGKRVAVTRGTDPHIFLVRALQSVGLTEKRHHAGAAAASGRQDRADPRRRRGLGRPRSDDGAGRGRGRRQAVLPQAGGQHLGHPQRARGVPQGSSRIWCGACSPSTRRRASIRSPTTTR